MPDLAAKPVATSDGELAALFQLSLEMLCIASTDGFFKRLNPAFQNTLGYSQQELMARPLVDFVHPDDQESTLRELHKLAEGQPTIRFDNRYRCADGSYRWLSWTAVPDSHGQRIYAAASDVTSRRHFEDALRESQRRYRQLLEAITTYRYSVEVRDGRTQFTWHSEGSLVATGYAPADFEADPYLWFNMIHADDRELVRRELRRVLANQDVPPIEHRIRHKNGQVRWVQDTIVLNRDERGRLIRYDGLVQDITERKRVEKRFRRLLESAPDAMVVVDGAGRIAMVSVRTEKLFGYSRQELLGRDVRCLLPERLRAGQGQDCFSSSAPSTGIAMHDCRDLYCLRKNGDEFPAQIFVSPTEGDDGVLLYAAIRDISEHREAQARVAQRTGQLAQLNAELSGALAALQATNEQLVNTQLQLVQAAKTETVGRLAAGIAHEVKNPLAIASLAVEYLSSRINSDCQTVEAITELQQAIKRADVAVQGLMRFARPGKPNLKPGDLKAPVETALLMLKRELALAHVTVTREYDPSIPSMRIDASSIEQVFINIFMNAIDAMPHGGKVTVRIRVARPPVPETDCDLLRGGSFRPHDTLVIAEVEDTGVGIPPEKLPQIFEPFFTTKPVGKGTGLGLTVCRSIVKLHGGTIAIANCAAGGVRVTIVLKGMETYASQEESPDRGR